MNQTEAQWFCLRAKPKHEHIAAGHLQALAAIPVFVPRIRFRRSTRRGVMWVTEALFPCYFFACLNKTMDLRSICHSPGVSGIVHFGSHWPVVPSEVIEDLKASLGQDIVTVSSNICPGDEVCIIGGSLQGFMALVKQVMPSARRVAVLMDFLGRQTTVELGFEAIEKEGNARETLWPELAKKPIAD